MSSFSYFSLVVVVAVLFFIFGQAINCNADCSPIDLKNQVVLSMYPSSETTYFRAEVYDPNNANLQFKVYTVKPSTELITIQATLEDCSNSSSQSSSSGFGVVSYLVEQAPVGVYIVAVSAVLDNYIIQACVDGCPFICPGDCSSNGFCDQSSGTCLCNLDWMGESCSTPSDWNPNPNPEPPTVASPNEAAHSFVTSFIISFLIVFSFLVCFRCCRRRTCKNQGYSKLPQTEVPLLHEPKKSTGLEQQQVNTVIEEPQQTQTSIPIPHNTVWTINEALAPQDNQTPPPFYLYPQTQTQQPYFYFPTQQGFPQYFSYPASNSPVPAYARTQNSNLN